jgi:Na+(H+)/acetate symporter ActP
VVLAFQYWLKLFAIAAPTFVLCAVFFTGGGPGTVRPLGSPLPPVFPTATTVRVQTDVSLRVITQTWLTANGKINDAPARGTASWGPGIDYKVAEGTRLEFDPGTPVPVVTDATPSNADWLHPGSGSVTSLLRTYSLIVATFLGTMGLPHVLVRFYTNPDGKAARRTTVHVLLLLGLFYLFPIMLGGLSRMYVPELLLTGQTDAAVLRLPTAMLAGVPGQVLGAVTTAGAFAAFLSTSSGILVSVAGVVSTDVLPGRVKGFRVATVLVAILPAALALLLKPEDLVVSVGMSFALAASTFSPLLVLGIWWRKLTWPGAMAGMTVGGGLVIGALVLKVVSDYTGDWAPWYAGQPALITVPAAFLVTVVISLATQYGKPEDVNGVMLRMHAPDPLGFMRDRAVGRVGQVEEKVRTSRGRHRR